MLHFSVFLCTALDLPIIFNGRFFNVNMIFCEDRILFCFQFEKPGRRDDFDYPQMAKEAVTKALNDAGLQISDIKQACVGYVYGM